MVRYNRTERLGVAAVQQITDRDLGWIFREQTTVDLGIDAHIELVQNQKATGKLIAVQIKTGRSHFHETPEALVYYGDADHVKYWAGYSLPVILVAHLPDTDETFWVNITANTGPKIVIPKRKRFGQSTKRELLSLCDSRVLITRHMGSVTGLKTADAAALEVAPGRRAPLLAPRGLSPADIPSVISRQALSERFGGSRQAGICASSRSPDVFLICVPTCLNVVGFVDGWKEDGCFHYSGEGLTADQELLRGNRTIAEAAQKGRSLRLFQGISAALEYQGRFELDPGEPYYWTYAAVTSRFPRRKIIVFRLRPLDGPGKPASEHKPPFRSWSSSRTKHYVRPNPLVPPSLHQLRPPVCQGWALDRINPSLLGKMRPGQLHDCAHQSRSLA